MTMIWVSRDYSPQLGRFTTVDPIRDGENWYAYAENDPVNYVDRWGLSASDKETVAQYSGQVIRPSTPFVNDTMTSVPNTPTVFSPEYYASIDPEGPNSTSGSTGATNTPQPQVPYDPADYHCDINSWNQAITQGYDPTPSSGAALDFNDLTVAEIYPSYSAQATDHPTADTGGFGFYDTNRDSIPDHMFFYEYDSGDTYTVWDSPGITSQTEQTWTINGTGDERSTFVPLPSL